MSYESEFWELQRTTSKKKKKKEEETNVKVSNKPYAQQLEIAPHKVVENNVNSGFIAPILSAKPTVTSRNTDDDKAWYEKILQKPELFDDGYQVGDIAKTILGTAADLSLNALSGAGNFVEGITDTIGYGIADVSDALGADDFANSTRERVKKSIVQNVLGGITEKADRWSVLGDTSDAVAQGLGMVGTVIAGGYVLGGAGLGTGAVSAITSGLTGLSGFGSGMSEAYQGGATDSEARVYGVITGASEALSELMFGGLGKVSKAVGFSRGLSSFDDVLAKKVSNLFSNQIVKNLAEYGIKSGAEGFEEVVAGIAQGIGKKITYMSEEELGKILKDESLLEQFVVGSVTSSFAQASGLHNANKTGTDFVSGLNENEQKVVDRVVEDLIAERKANGEKVTNKTKNKIYDDVIKDLDKGYIDTDTIESTLGGEEYETYKRVSDRGSEYEAKLNELIEHYQAEYDSFSDIPRGEMTRNQIDREAEVKKKLNELKTELEDYKKDKTASDLKTKLGQNVFDLVKGTRLAESYREIARHKQNFEADTEQYENEYAKRTVQNAIDYRNDEGHGLDNTNASHDFIDLMTKYAADREVEVVFTTTKGLTELKKNGNKYGIKADPNKINAFVSKEHKKLFINMDTDNNLYSLVGHEVTHTTESAKHYEGLLDSVKSFIGEKEFDELYKKKAKTYEDFNLTKLEIEQEIVADFCGERLLTDYDFVKHLAVNNQNIFQKAWESIKHLYKMATAGSKEARQLERVKRNFEKAYKESAKSADAGVKHSLSDNNISDTSTGYASGETYFTMSYKKDGKVVGTIEYGEYEGQPNVKMIEVESEYRRQGIGTKLLQELQKKYSDKEIQFGMSTPDGTKLLESITYDVTDEAVVSDREKLKALQTELSELQDKLDVLYDTENPTEAQKTEVDKLGDRWNEVYDSIRELEQTLRGKRATKTFVKTDTRYSLSAEQEAYFKDSKVRDENGTLKVMYHGTSKGGHTVFDTYGSKYGLFGQGSYFTDNKSVAESYTNKGKGDNKQVYETYLNITNPIDMDAQADVDAWAKALPEADFSNCTTNEDCYRAMEEYFEDEQYSKYEASEIAIDVIQGMGYDGITHIGGGRVNAEGTRHQVYIAFEPEQIKNIDNIAPTKDADIRYSLSETDNKYLDAVNRGDTETAQRIVDEVAKENGYTIKAYHGTRSGEFFVFDKNRVGENYGGYNAEGGAFDFSTDEDRAYRWGAMALGLDEVRTMPVYLKAEKTFYSYDGKVPSELESLLPSNMTADEKQQAMSAGYAFKEALEKHGINFKEAIMSMGYDSYAMYPGHENIGVYTAEQIKSADAITYDDNGNVIPLSERFKTENNDIRYSLSDSDGSPIDDDRIVRNESDIRYSINKAPEIADGQSKYASTHKRYITDDELKEAHRVTQAMVDVMMKYSSILPEDKIGKVLTKNGSYDRSVENTTICVRTLAYNEFVDKVQEELGRPLTQMESFLVSQKLYDIATEPQCLYCYVSLDRKAFNDMLLRYMQDRDTVIAKYNNSNKTPEAIKALYEEFLNGRKDTKPMKERFNKWLDYVDNGTQLLSLADIATEARQTELTGILAEQLKDARKYAQSASWSKIQKNYVAYKDEILKLGDRVVKNLNEHYGLRWYSFSDYSPAFIVENMQQITDAAIRGLKGLSYTKDTDFAEVFAPSGMNINISVFVKRDANGNYYIDERQSADIEKAKDLRNRYPNVGIVATVTDDEALRWAGQQEWSDVIIPFHIVRTGADVAEYYKWLNYTGESADTIKDKDLWNAYVDSLNLKSENARKKVSKNIYPNEHNNDKATYLALCESRGLTPRFVRYAGEDWYMKLVNETRLSAENSTRLKPVFSLDAAQKSFDKFIKKGGYEGGWYKDGVDVDAEAKIVADDVLAGRKANEVEYGRQDGIAPESLIAKRKTHRTHGRFSLSEEAETFGKHGGLEIYAKDITTPSDIAPIQETAESSVSEPTAQSVAPTQEAAPTSVAEPLEETPTESNDAEEKPTRRSELHQKIVEGIKTKFAEKGFDFDEVLKKAKNLSTFATVDNIPQRVMEKALGYKQGQALADETVNKVAQNESEGIKWLNSFTDRKNGVLAQISKQYNIKPGSKKSAAAQMYAEGFYVGKNNEIIKYGDEELAIDFPDARVRENIKGLARDPRIRQIYDETLEAINESRRRNLYPEIQRLDNYFLHFRAMEDTFSRLGLPFNPNDIRAKDLPTDLNGVTADLKPGQPYFASAKHREGMRTSFDLLGGLERYLSSAKNQIYHIDDIQTLRALRNYIADSYGQAKGLESLDNLSEEEAQERIEQVYGSHLSTFAKFLNEEANVLAGKTTLIDRGLEGIIGRRGITILNTLNSQVGSNMVGFNGSSSLTNFLPVVQTFAKTNKFDFTKAFAQIVSSKIGSIFGKTDSFVENNPTIIRRKGAERFYRTPFQKIGDTGYVLMSAVDDISTELIVRTKYNELVRKGMDEQKASFEADKWVSRLMGDRSLGQQPQLYNSKMLGIVTKFQLEVRNQLDSQFYDTVQEAKVSNEEIESKLLRNAKTAAKVGSTFFQLAVLQHLFGKAFESVAGYNPAFDIVEVLIKTLGFDDDEEDEDTVLDNIEEGFFALLEDLPYTSTFTGGRIPISSALPIKEFLKGEDQYGNEKSRWDTIKETAPYYLLPTGYGQIKKTAQGLGMFSDKHPVAGSYTDSGNLRFPVEDTLWNRVQAGVFGQYANENARTYFDEGYAPLKEKQIQEYIDVEMPIKDYWQYREGLKDLTKQDEKAAYINGLNISKKQKDVLKSYLYDEEGYKKENPEKYAFLEKEGIGYLGYKELDEDTQSAWSWAFKHQDEYEHFKENGVLPGDYSTYYIPMLDFKDEDDKAYQWSFDNPEKATLGKVFGEGVKEYRKYTNDLYDIGADKDSNGKSISGSAKEKKKAYIWSLDIDEGAKYILFKNEYKADDTYNNEIIDYLNSRDDISYDEMNTICEELGFKVNRETGYISWD